MYVHGTDMYVQFCKCIMIHIYVHVFTILEMYIHVHTCIYISRIVHTYLNHVCTIALSEDSMYMVQTCMYMFMSGGQDSRCILALGIYMVYT